MVVRAHGPAIAVEVQLTCVARLIGLVRKAKVLARFELPTTMIEGFASAMAAMFWGIVLIMIAIII